MQFSGPQLRAILANQRDGLDVRDQNGGPVMVRVPVARALRVLDLERYVGIGNRARIRYLRPAVSTRGLGSGSQTTREVRADHSCTRFGPGQLMGNSRTLREHKPVF
jgi:hypothetical protein